MSLKGLLSSRGPSALRSLRGQAASALSDGERLAMLDELEKSGLGWFWASDANGHTIACAFADLSEVSKALEARLGAPASAKIIWKPQNTVLVDEEKAQSVMKLLDNLDNDDDVQNVFSNFEVSDEVMAKLTA